MSPTQTAEHTRTHTHTLHTHTRYRYHTRTHTDAHTGTHTYTHTRVRSSASHKNWHGVTQDLRPSPASCPFAVLHQLAEINTQLCEVQLWFHTFWANRTEVSTHSVSARFSWFWAMYILGVDGWPKQYASKDTRFSNAWMPGVTRVHHELVRKFLLKCNVHAIVQWDSHIHDVSCKSKASRSLIPHTNCFFTPAHSYSFQTSRLQVRVARKLCYPEHLNRYPNFTLVFAETLGLNKWRTFVHAWKTVMRK